MLHPFSEIQLSTQKKEMINTQHNLDESQRHFAEERRLVTNYCILSDSFTGHSKEDKNLDGLWTENRSGMGGC